MAGSGGPSSGGMSSVGGTAGSSGAGGTAGLAGGGGTGPTCDVGSLRPFARSDTDAAWDDNDFSDLVIDQTMCPVLVDVTWPHEAGWENADPSEANFEQVRFTLDSYPVVADLTNKQLNVTIELAEDMLGPLATDGGYVVSLVSVSTFQRVVPIATGGASGSAGFGGTGGEMAGMAGSAGSGGTMAGMGGAGMSGAGGTAGMSGAGGMGGTAGAGGTDAAGTGGTAGDAGGAGGSGGEMTVTETGYAEAETPEEERRVLYYPGDRVTVRFPLPAKSAADSYDPATAIKVNIRVYNLFDTGEDEPMGIAGAGGVAGMGGMSGAGAFGTSGMAGAGGTSGAGGSAGRGGMAGTSGIAGMGGMSGTSGTAGTSGMANAGMSGEAGTAGAGGMSGAGGTDGMQPLPVYDYVTSTFAITNFTVTDVGAP
jgi:hypothetical protein